MFLKFFGSSTVSDALKNFQPIRNNKKINESTSAATDRYKQLTNPSYAEQVFSNKLRTQDAQKNISNSRINEKI
ncbi:hypothetical protein [Sporosarcina obsidiansis]|uniref:hypothetical protein n=1 Tax=Sporosarcina obsidiansis TaxID=2660748 RepID=UPI00129A779B|nr:hypothetical protein [Sporosarcina obsidiansis]